MWCEFCSWLCFFFVGLPISNQTEKLWGPLNSFISTPNTAVATKLHSKLRLQLPTRNKKVKMNNALIVEFNSTFIPDDNASNTEEEKKTICCCCCNLGICHRHFICSEALVCSWHQIHIRTKIKNYDVEYTRQIYSNILYLWWNDFFLPYFVLQSFFF